MKVIAQDAIDLIRRDAEKGIFQNNTGPHEYGSHGDTKGRSKKTDGNNKYKNGQKYLYPDYKARGMRRFKDGAKLKGFKAKATNTDANFVNMNLSGRTLRSMRPGARKNTAIIRFDNASIVLGNRARKPKGYDLFEVGTGTNVSIKNIVKLIKKICKNKTSKLNFGKIPMRKNELYKVNLNLKVVIN